MNVEFEDQGRGVLFSHMVVAEEYLKASGKKVTDDEMKKVIMKLAREKADSYTPSEELGRNPESRLSKEVKDSFAPWLYGKDSSVVKALNMPNVDKKAFMIELNGAVNHLVQIILKNAYGFKTTRSKSATLYDPRQLTDFEYVASGPGGLDKAQRDMHNTTVDVNRQIRGFLQAYITASLIPLLNDDKASLYKAFKTVYEKANPKLIRSVNVYKNLMRNAGLFLFVKFSKIKTPKDFLNWEFTRLSQLISRYRITPKGEFQLEAVAQTQKPSKKKR